MGMPEHGGPQAAAFARACKSSPPPSLFNLPSQARAFFFVCVSIPLPRTAPAERTEPSSLDAGGAVVKVESTGEEAGYVSSAHPFGRAREGVMGSSPGGGSDGFLFTQALATHLSPSPSSFLPRSPPVVHPHSCARPRSRAKTNARQEPEVGREEAGVERQPLPLFFLNQARCAAPALFLFYFSSFFFLLRLRPCRTAKPTLTRPVQSPSMPRRTGQERQKERGGGTKVALKKHKTAPPRTRRADLRPLSRSPPPSHLAAPFTAASYRTPTSRQLTTFHTAFK
jgi:hypothetical protein